MVFGPTTVEMCGCLYPSAGPKNFEIRGAKRANEFGLVVSKLPEEREWDFNTFVR
jgi:hypothetical protein